MHFLDTNILLYSVSSRPAEKAKSDRAAALLRLRDGSLSVQVLHEFYVQAIRPSRPDRLTHEMAVALMDRWKRFTIQDNTVAILDRALEITARHRFSYWDSAVIAAACTLGCDILYSEDLKHGQIVDGIRIVNPFL